MTSDLDRRNEARAVSVGVMIVAAVIGAALVSLTPDRSQPTAIAASPLPTRPSLATTPPSATAATSPPVSSTLETTTSAPVTTPDPGGLPQTEDKPAANGTTFTTRVQGLWNAIIHDNPTLAMPFFFPKRAYLQVKAIADPELDYESRLIAHYEDDIHALHGQIGGDAAQAQLDGIDVPGSDAVWVQPGEESNKLSYWRVYGSVLRYTVNGAARTFPVTSLISWRGEWYVVHLGTIR
ncbi:MAG TPA: hypothetical protein VGA62_09920 [Acidimicrobiia bacterium]